MMLRTTKAKSSLKRFSNHAGIPSAPVAFLELRCLSVDLTCPTDGNGGGTSFRRCESVCSSVGAVGQTSSQGLINACCSCSTKCSVTSAGGIRFGESLIVASPYIVFYHFYGCETRRSLLFDR